MAKATAECTCKVCGMKFIKAKTCVNRRDADSWEVWAADYYTECEACESKRIDAEREAQNAKAAETASENEWPELTGTEKQVAWANTIRLKMVEEAEKMISDTIGKVEEMKTSGEDAKHIASGEKLIARLEEVEQYILSKTVASWFIDNRYDGGNRYKTLFVRISEKIDAGEIHVEQKPEKEEQTILRPQNQTHEGVVEVTVKEDAVCASYEKDDTFREIVKALGYIWDKNASAWKKSISQRTGSSEERAAELGNKLLNAGFAVMLQDAAVREAAVKGDYQPESQRWITFEKGMYVLRWERGEESIYEKAKRLHSAKWSSDLHGMTLPATETVTVEDFAHVHGFSFSEKAEEQRMKFHGSTATVSPAEAKIPVYDEHPTSEILSSSREIIDDLKDE